jgi:hypothetical protein
VALRRQVERFLVDAHALPRLHERERIEIVERTVTFLAEVLLPHADAEERVLYPQASRLLGEQEGGTGDERGELRRLVGELAEADVRDTGRLQEIFYALYALLEAHFWRGDAVYLKLMRLRHQGPVRALLDRVRGYERRGRFTRARPATRT